MIVLRQDQLALKFSINKYWNDGISNVLAVLPTGGGKSIIVSDIALDLYNLHQNVAVIAHRNELVSQMSSHLARRGIYHKIIASSTTIRQITKQHRKVFGKSYINPTSRTAVVGVDTLVSRAESLKDWASQIHYWIIDEAHHVIGGRVLDGNGNPAFDKDGKPLYNTEPNKWGKAVAMFTRAKGLGVTATPCRADGKGLGREFDGVFDVMTIGVSMRYLINNNALSDYEIVCPTSDLEIDDEEVSKDGDWSSNKLKKAAQESHIVGDVVLAYLSYGFWRPTIVFATDVETSNDIARRFNEAGIPAASLSAETNPAVREKYIEEFKEGKIRVLVNVDLFDEGFDVPACAVVIMARPTASLGKYRQMVGRALRYVAGKTALIIDLVSNVARHGLPDKHIEWTLARRDKRGKNDKDPDEIDMINCLNRDLPCLRPFEKFRTCCPYCGWTKPLPEPMVRTIKMVEGDLTLLSVEKLAEMRKAMDMESPASVQEKTAFVAGEFAGRGALNRQLEKWAAKDRLEAAIKQWAGIERHKGFNDAEIQKKFYLTLGIDVLTAMDGSQTRQQFETLAMKVEKWYMK